MKLINGSVVCHHKWIMRGDLYDKSSHITEYFNGVFCDKCGMRGSYNQIENPVSSVYVFSHNIYETAKEES